MFRVKEIAKILNSELVKCNKDTYISGISTDTRKDVKGKLFIPLKGSNFNGHDFVELSIKNGASAVLVSEDRNWSQNLPIIKTDDTLKALGKIAKYYAEKNNFKIIAITGSAGKTTTKNILKHITKFYGTEKNFNNLIGVPLTILNAKEEEEFIIVELGINIVGEMAQLNDITTPEYAIITNIGYGHLEGFGSVLKVFEEKSLIIRNNSDLIKGFVHENIDIKGEKIFTFGESENTDCRLIESISDCYRNRVRFSYKEKIYNIESKLLGKFNALNIVTAFLVARELGFDDEYILQRLETFTPSDKRSEMIRSNKGFFLFNDCYNANFDSFKEAINFIDKLNVKGKKIAIIGDMYELGQLSEELHSKLGEIISNTNIDYVLGTGEFVKATLGNINKKDKVVKYFKNKEDIIDYINSNIGEEDIILLKASRAMKFEEIARGILNYSRG